MMQELHHQSKGMGLRAVAREMCWTDHLPRMHHFHPVTHPLFGAGGEAIA